MSAADWGRVTTIITLCAASAVWVAFWFARWVNEGLDAARQQYAEDMAERDAIEAEYVRATTHEESLRDLARIESSLHADDRGYWV